MKAFSDYLAQRVSFLSPVASRGVVSSLDDVTESWSKFDIQSRLRTETQRTKEDLLAYIRDQVLPWKPDEVATINRAVSEIDKRLALQEYKLNLPDEIQFVKSTLQEEGGFQGYTRQNFIVLRDGITNEKLSDIIHLILHELFHILSRHDPIFRRKAYQNIGFEICNDVRLPEPLSSRKITNPDSPKTDSFILLEKDGKEIECVMILYSSEEYSGGPFPTYLKSGLLLVSGEANNKEPIIENGDPTIVEIGDVLGFFEKVGRNTNYIIQPEEILADNFTHSALYPNLDIIEGIQQLCKT